MSHEPIKRDEMLYRESYVKELRAQNEAIKQENEALRKQVEQLKGAVSGLEAACESLSCYEYIASSTKEDE